MKKLRCFVAMAFDKPDLDLLYEKSIAPLLKMKQITPRRVDKIQHNEEITFKIRNEIEQADFAIVDLTYSRPSVYYEAGYAERKVPVIYTVKKDHLKPKTKDKSDIFTIHFDLRGKNIIPWVTPNDKYFISELKKRINFTTQPLRVLLEQFKLMREAEEKYFSLSPLEKRLLSSKYLEKLIGRFHYRINLEKYNIKRVYPQYYWQEFLLYNKLSSFHLFAKVFSKVSKQEMESIRSYYTFPEQDILEKLKSKIKHCSRNIIRTFILISTSKVNFNLLVETFSNLKIGTYKSIKYLFTLEEAKMKRGKKRIYSSDLLILIDNINSELDLNNKIENAYELLMLKSRK